MEETDKDKLHEQELASIAAEIEAVKNGTHKELLAGYRKIGEDSASYLCTVESTRNYCRDNIRKLHKANQTTYASALKKSKTAARKRLISDLETEKEKTKLWFDTSKIDESEQDLQQSRKTRRTRGDAQDDGSSGKEPSAKQANPPNTLPVFKLELSDADIAHDVRIFKEGKHKSKGSAQAHAPDKEYECYYEHHDSGDDRLRYDTRSYHRGYKVTVERPKSSHKVTGHIFMFTPQEVWLRKADLTKYGFRISELANGKLTLRVATGRSV